MLKRITHQVHTHPSHKHTLTTVTNTHQTHTHCSHKHTSRIHTHSPPQPGTANTETQRNHTFNNSINSQQEILLYGQRKPTHSPDFLTLTFTSSDLAGNTHSTHTNTHTQ